MKKTIMCIATLLALNSYAQKKEVIQAGVNAGLMVGNFANRFSAEIEPNISYLWSLNNQTNFGIYTGYTHYFQKDGRDGVGAIPIAARIEYFFNPQWFFGGNFGLHIGTNKGTAIYVNPQIGTKINENIKVFGAYKGSLATGAYGSSLSSINVGLAYIIK